MKKCFPVGSKNQTLNKYQSMRDIITETKPKIYHLETALEKGIFLCNKKCQVCQKQHLISGTHFHCTETKKVMQ